MRLIMARNESASTAVKLTPLFPITLSAFANSPSFISNEISIGTSPKHGKAAKDTKPANKYFLFMTFCFVH